MVELLVATSNRGKILEIRTVLSEAFPDIKILTPDELDIRESPEETADSFLGNSIAKSLFYSRIKRDTLTIADDSGLEVRALNGKPGVHSARYAGDGSTDAHNMARLLNEMKGIEDREARFVSVITLSINGSVIRSFRGEVKGIIIDQKRGNSGFGYDPIFFYTPLQKTFAELAGVEKNRISHRAEALIKLKNYLTTPGGQTEKWMN